MAKKSNSGGALSLSAEELLTLNGEIAAIARSGISLPAGLLALAEDLPGRIGIAAQEIGARLEKGEQLGSILAGQSSPHARLYAALVDAGVKAGQLPAALESFATTVRRWDASRRAAIGSLIYPALLATIAWILFAIVGGGYLASLLAEYEEFGLSPPNYLPFLASVGSASKQYWYVPPLLAIAVLILLWFSYRPLFRRFPQLARWCERLPGWGPLLKHDRRAAFAEVLSLLVSREIPLAEAVPLAAETTGDPALQQGAGKLAAIWRQGGSPSSAERAALGLPAFAGWLLAGGASGSRLAEALKSSAARDRKSAERQADWLAIFLPLATTIGIGGAVALAFGWSVLAPWYTFLVSIAES